MEQWKHTHGKGSPMDAIRQNDVAMEVMRLGETKGLADLRFTIKIGAKHLQNSENDYTARDVGKAKIGVGSSNGKGVKVHKFTTADGTEIEI